MGWLFMRSLGGHATPKAYIDAQFTYVRPEGRSRVLASRQVGMRTYYAAVEHVAVGAGSREVWGLVCLVRHNPRDREGYVFGYKTMSESMGPVEDACPADVLDLLTPTDKTFALDWRARCRARLAERRAVRAKPVPRPGQLVVFAAPIRFRNGRSFRQLRAVRLPGRARGLVFQAQDGGLYRIRGLKALDYTIAPATPPALA
ncbi:MAG: hypothetical protein B7Z44_19135 [Caulobacter sp. 12-67-6]|uniref:DUF6927 domain-containing protein n=1 Tax=uncultured Caulobacter sp. TaxID=158749 RepID=UPI000BCA42DD|nr:hypothetical protein [uncultured Caulobacter sp.]OYW25357.1 MAG: hypothetical protein B7Z44_19135 [Caulobacter sp. 12-67-6]